MLEGVIFRCVRHVERGVRPRRCSRLAVVRKVVDERPRRTLVQTARTRVGLRSRENGSAGDGGTPLTTAANIIDRLIGDGSRQSDGNPTYGFHRHSVAAGATDVYTKMRLVSQSEAHDDDAEEFVFVLEFEVYVTTT